MSAQRRRCPVCWRLVGQTRKGFIEAHTDKMHIPCRGVGEPYRIALSYPTFRDVAS